MKKLYIFIAALSLLACNDETIESYSPQFSSQPAVSETSYIVGIHPLHNPQRLHEVFAPLIAYLNKNIPHVRFKLEASRNYDVYDKKLYAKTFDFALPNPFQTINAVDKGYRVFAKMGDDDVFRGIILVRKDSNIKWPKDLVGKAVSYPAPTALAATMLPQYYLQTHGVNIMQDLDNRYVGSQESSIMNVYQGDTVAGATWLPPWLALSRERPELARELKVIWQTQSLPNNALVVLPTVPDKLVDDVKSLLLSLHEHDEGREILAKITLSRFESADNDSYQAVRDFIVKFSATVRPIN
ncbi:MAG: phosphate/phosphite/phosphonate ABC transporter substrate-binding protein [Gammaproteobacteria bacterium]|nr:phosphate/phosphite/phosphonate ABC transporter substrate-binding protein [Gammaproteobacteria bacterium]